MRTYRLFIFLIILLSGISKSLFSQTKITPTGNQEWLHYYNELQLTKKWTLLSDCGYRWKNGFQEHCQYIARAGIAYRLNTPIRFAAGFAHLGFFTNDRIGKMEFRPYQEVQLKTNLSRISLVQRLRIEERILYPYQGGLIHELGTFNFRFRYSFIFNIPLFKLKNESTSMFFLGLGNELFINAGAQVADKTFDQNRILISPTYKLNEQLSIALTWNNQIAGTGIKGKLDYTSIIWLQLKHILIRRKTGVEKRGIGGTNKLINP